MRPQFRILARDLSPRFLRGPNGSAFMCLIGMQFDKLMERQLQGSLLGCSARCDATALPYLGRDRGIGRGPDESETAYRVRLAQYRGAWRLAGHAYGMLEQLAGYLSPHVVPLRIWTNSGVCYYRDAAGSKSVSYADLTHWVWDGSTSLWSRFWVVIYPPSSLWTIEGTYGNGDTWVAGDTRCNGFSATKDEITGLRALIRLWKPAHTKCEKIIVAFDAASFRPGDSLPTSTWANWSTGDPVAPSRLATARYGSGE